MSVAYSYIRFSTPEQKKGDSLRRQTELSEAYASEHGLTLDNTLHLHDLGLSAFDRSNIERGALGGFLEAVKLGRIVPGSYLLVESLDRLSRDTVLAALEIFMSILRHDITIVTLADRMVYNTQSVGSNFASLIISITIMARAHEESAMKSRRILAAWAGKRARIAEKKLTARCPGWLRLNKEKTEFELIPDRVAVVMEVLDWHKAGMGQAQIAKRLNQRSEPSFSNHGKGWHTSYIQKIITGTALYGEYQPRLWNKGDQVAHGEPIPNYYPALISKEEFHLLASLRSQRHFPGAKARKGTSVPNLLSGIVKCGYCGSTMILAGGAAQRVRSDDGGKVTRPGKKVLVCDGARRGLGCFAVQWTYKDFETSFLMFCRTLQLGELLSEFITVDSDEERQLTISEKHRSVKSAIEECKKRIDRLVEVLELGNTPASVLERIRQLEHEFEILKTSEAALDAELVAVETSARNRTLDVASVQDLVEQLDTLEGDKLFMVRSALAEHIRQVIDVVGVFPAGLLSTPETIERIRSALMRYGSSAKSIETYLAGHVRTEPIRTGRGVRGRYASRKEVPRFFIIKARNGGYRLVYPDFDEPAKLVIELGSDKVSKSSLDLNPIH